MATGSLMIRCMAAASSGPARRSRSRSVLISSMRLHRLFEHRLEHRTIETAGVLVVATAMIAIEKPAATWKFVDCAMAECQAGRRQAKATAYAVMRDLAQRDEGGESEQAFDRGPQIWPAIGFLRGQRPVLRRKAFHRVENDRMLEPKPVVTARAIVALSQTELEQGFVEKFASSVAREGPAGTIGAAHAGREADDRQPGIWVAERRHRRVPPIRMFGSKCVAKRNQPWAEQAISRRFGVRDRREIGGAGATHGASLGGQR